MIARVMTTEPLPSQIDALKLAALAGRVCGRVAVAALPGVTDLLANDAGEVSAELQFDIDERGIRTITGQVKAQLQVTCQRCMRPMPIAVNSSFLLGMVWSDDEARQLPRNIEPLVLVDEVIVPAEIVAEELILSIPFVSYHDPADCDVSDADLRLGPELPRQPARENPFKILDQLKSDKD